MFITLEKKKEFHKKLLDKFNDFKKTKFELKHTYLILDANAQKYISQLEVFPELKDFLSISQTECILLLHCDGKPGKYNLRLQFRIITGFLILNYITEERVLELSQIQKINVLETNWNHLKAHTVTNFQLTPLSSLFKDCLSLRNIKADVLIENQTFFVERMYREIKARTNTDSVIIYSELEHVKGTLYVIRLFIFTSLETLAYDAGCQLINVL